LGILLVAAAVSSFAGCGSSDGPNSPPFTSSDSWVRAECLMGTYLPEQVGEKVAGKPPPNRWSKIEEAAGALVPDRGAVEVMIRPVEKSETITFTGIDLEVQQHRLRPTGTVFYHPCNRRLRGPVIEVDVDGSGEIASSSTEEELEPGLQISASASPIKFPWTVRLRKPIHLYLVAHTENCYCSWSARMRWESDSSHGAIRIDNGSEKYTMTDSIGAVWQRPGPGGRWVQMLPPLWTGVR
jgi:hypothetical protein